MLKLSNYKNDWKENWFSDTDSITDVSSIEAAESEGAEEGFPRELGKCPIVCSSKYINFIAC